MPRPTKLLLGVATAVPLVLIGYLLVRFLSFFLGVVDHGGVVFQGRIADAFHELLTVQLTTLGLLVALLGVYLWHLLVHNARRDPSGHVPLWVIALVFVPMFAMPIYWLTKIWPESEAPQRGARRA